MGTLTNDSTKASEMSGVYKFWSFNNLSVSTASDTLTLTATANGISEITNVFGSISGGQDELFAAISPSYSGLDVTVTSKAAAGTASTSWADATVNLLVIGK